MFDDEKPPSNIFHQINNYGPDEIFDMIKRNESDIGHIVF